MPRLFTAIEVPPEIALSLSMLRGGLPGARWIDADNYHITLRFIGDIDGRTADEIAAALSRIERRAMRLRIRGLDAFGGNKPHALYAGVEANPALAELQGEHERILQRIGLKAEGRRYIPHVTLARLRNARPADIATYLSLRGSFSTEPFEVERFVLFSSKDSVGGGPYIAEEHYPLLTRPAVRAPHDRHRPSVLS
jgi:2'-5' RNA ligase